jgi:hypothetical protein
MTASVIRSPLLLAALVGAVILALAPSASQAQQTPAKKAHAAQTAKAGKGEKVCRVKLQYTGEVRTWICPKEVPCCVWHEINYVKCGSTITGCL